MRSENVVASLRCGCQPYGGELILARYWDEGAKRNGLGAMFMCSSPLYILMGFD